MAFLFNSSITQLNTSLFSTVGQAASARTLQAAVLGRNSPSSNTSATSGTIPNQARQEARARQATRVLQGYSTLTIKQKTAVKTLQKTNDQLDEMKALLLQARELIVKAGNSDAAGQRDLANEFDQLIGQYNLKMRSAGYFGTNLIGSDIRDIYQGNDLEVPIKPGSRVNVTYPGTFLGSDYVITDANGNKYVPNLFGSALTEFPPQDPNDTGILLQNDDTVSYDPTTGAVSITRAGDSTPVLSGTLEKKGVGVLHSYFYGDFKDATLRDQAQADVESALNKLRFNISVYGAQQKRAEVALQFSQDQIETNKNVAASVEADKFAAQRRAQLEEQKRQLIFQSSLQQSQSGSTGGANGLLQSALNYNANGSFSSIGTIPTSLFTVNS